MEAGDDVADIEAAQEQKLVNLTIIDLNHRPINLKVSSQYSIYPQSIKKIWKILTLIADNYYRWYNMS